MNRNVAPTEYYANTLETTFGYSADLAVLLAGVYLNKMDEFVRTVVAPQPEHLIFRVILSASLRAGAAFLATAYQRCHINRPTHHRQPLARSTGAKYYKEPEAHISDALLLPPVHFSTAHNGNEGHRLRTHQISDSRKLLTGLGVGHAPT